jgi:beta-lactamase regulating signal transducer with metallopeptidase domain
MNEIAASLLVTLLRMSLFLGAAALALQLLLKFARTGSSRVHRAAWFLVLLQGWFWWRLPVTIPCCEPAVVKQVSSAPITPITLPSPAPVPAPIPIQIAGENYAVAHHPAISHHENDAIDAPRPVDRRTAQSWAAIVGRNWPVAILGGWAAGMLTLAGASIVSYLRFLRCLHATHPVEEVWVREWDDLLARHHVHTGVPLWVTANVGPLLCLVPRGYRLVVPAGLWQRLAPEGRLSILRHELAHLERRDLLKSIFVRLLMLPHWFNPLAWLAVRRFDEAAEWACDEVAKGADLEGCRAYARALLQLDAACGPRPSYHAAASGRGLSVRVQRLLSPQVKEDSIMKKTTILGIALGLALLCLVRLDLVAKEPAEKDRAETAPQTQSAKSDFGSQLGAQLGAITGAAVGDATGAPEPAPGTPLGIQPQKPKTTPASGVLRYSPASVDVLRYMPDGCQGIFWADVAELRKTNPAWLKKSFGPGYGLRAEDIDRITVGSPVWPTPHDYDSDFFQFCDVSHAVAKIVVPQRVTALEAKEQIEKNLGKSPWSEETIHGVTLHVQQSKEPIAFCLPAKQTLVIGPAKLVREVLVRGTPVQLSGKLAEAWARLDQSHAIGLMMAPPAAGDPARAFLPDDLCDGTEVILLEADMVAGKDVRFRFSVPCSDAGIAYQVRGLCATFCKATGAGYPQFADAAKSLQFAVNDRCFVLQGTLPEGIFQDDLKSATPAVGYTPLSFLPDELRDGIEAIQFEAEMDAGKDLRLSFSVPCVDAGIAYEVRGLCATFCKVMGSQTAGQFPSMNEVMKSFQFAVNDRCFNMQGTLPASIFQGGLTTSWRGLLPDDVCDGIEGILVKADIVPGKDIHFRFSVPCVDTGIAYQVRGLCATFYKAMETGLRQNTDPSIAEALKSIQFVVNDRSFVFQGTLPTSIFQDFLNRTTSTSQGPQIQPTPHQQALCELSQSYLKGFQLGLTDPANQEEAGRRLLAKARERDAEFPQDAKLNEAQRMFRDLSEVSDQGFLQAAQWQDLDPKQKADEERWLRQLSSDNESARTLAIYALMAMRSKKAVPGILQIAADRKEKDNADRESACRALGIIGDLSVVPDLVHLTYHYNQDTRFWAQISLVRLTGENFGRDVDAWRQWWEKQDGKPPISEERVAWATSPETLQCADPKDMEKADANILEMARKLSSADGKTGQTLPTQGQTKDIPLVENQINDIQPDGSIRFTSREEISNSSWIPMMSYQFMSSDICKIEKIADGKGRPVQFKTEHKGDHFYYVATLNEPVTTGQTLVLDCQGTITMLIKPTGQPGEFRYHMTHSPNAPFSVRQVEVFRLPPGAELLEKSSADMAETQSDGRIELRVERIIPAGDVIEVSYIYRLGGTK